MVRTRGTMDRVEATLARRIAERLGSTSAEMPAALEDSLAHLDPSRLRALLRTGGWGADIRNPPRARHLGVVGIDHALDRLVVEDGDGKRRPAPSLTDFDELDDDDLIAATQYVPESLPGNMLG